MLSVPMAAYAPHDSIATDAIAGVSAQLDISKPVADPRVTQLSELLNYYKSPLAPYAPVFIQKADEYGLPDWRLVPAIAGVESTFGKRIPQNSYNAYGWANGNYSFKNWEDSIDVVTKTLKQKYYARGADTVEEIAAIYAPPSKTWANNVHFFMTKLDGFEQPKQATFSL